MGFASARGGYSRRSCHAGRLRFGANWTYETRADWFLQASATDFVDSPARRSLQPPSAPAPALKGIATPMCGIPLHGAGGEAFIRLPVLP